MDFPLLSSLSLWERVRVRELIWFYAFENSLIRPLATFSRGEKG